MKMRVAILKILKEQQNDQRVEQEMQIAAVDSFRRVGEAIAEAAKIQTKGEEWKMILPSLKAMNFGEKLTAEVVKDAAKYKLWMRKFEAWVSSQAGSFNMEVKQCFKRVSEAKTNETTK